MSILLLRAWDPFPYFAKFSTIQEKGVGGTEFQLLLHARAIRDLGHEVTVLGISRADVTEEEILFQGSSGKEHLKQLLMKHHGNTDVIFTNVTENIAAVRAILPKAAVVQVCQNGPHFYADPHIDVYAFISYGQLAYYSVKFKTYRQKFMILPNVPPWYTFYSGLSDVAKENQIIWVGSFEKQGLRRWAKAMHGILKRNSSLKWVLCAPSYSLLPKSGVPPALFGINLPLHQLELKSMTTPELAVEIKRSKILLASLGGEDAGVSYLDGHALGVPVLCGDDIVGKFSNSEGMGLRCTTVAECEEAIEFLLANPMVCETMGAMGRKWIMHNMTEQHQRNCIEQILSYLTLRGNYDFPTKTSIQSDEKKPIRYWLERAEIKLLGINYGHKRID